MQQIFSQILQFLQQGIAAIFKCVQLVWTWSVGEIGKLTAVPWQSWPMWKQVLLVVIAAGVVWALYRAGKEWFDASERTLAAFAILLGALVKTLPSVVLAGLIALGGIWVLNSFDPSAIHVPTAWRVSSG